MRHRARRLVQRGTRRDDRRAGGRRSSRRAHERAAGRHDRARAGCDLRRQLHAAQQERDVVHHAADRARRSAWRRRARCAGTAAGEAPLAEQRAGAANGARGTSLAHRARRVPGQRGRRRRHHHARRRLAGAEHPRARPARPHRRSLLHPRRARIAAKARHRAQQRVDDHHRLVHRRDQSRRTGFTGDRRLERARALRHHEQLPRGSR